MTKQYTSDIFADTYKDDYRDSDNYHRILFNAGRALQAREVTQLQTIIQKEIGRFGRNIFKEGAAVNPGGVTINNRYEFIKLISGTTLPTDTTVLLDTVFIGQTSGVKAEVLEVVDAEGSDPCTLYVRYTDTSAGTSGTSPIRMSAGEVIDNGTYQFTVQTTNTTSNPAVGIGTKFSIAAGDFFVRGHFVFAVPQSKIISKYTNDPTTDVGFLVIQDIVTVEDNTALYDNQGASPNLSAPGADRYRIRLTITERDEVDSDETFVYIAKVENGAVVDEVQPIDDYNKINDLLALRTKEESGNYNVKIFKIKFEENDSNSTLLNLQVSDGISYIDGYRAAIDYPSKLIVNRAQDTVTLNNEVIAANYGNYVIGDVLVGIPNIDQLPTLNIRSAISYGGSTIGTCSVRAVEEDGSNFRFYLFNIVMNSGQSFRNAKSIGSSATSYFDLVLENSKAVLKDAGNANTLFTLPHTRPSSLSDISLTVQRRFTTTTDGSGNGSLSLSAQGETFANTNSWIFANADSAYDGSIAVTGSGTAAVTFTGGPPSSSNLEILAYVNKSQATSKTKTLTETTVTTTLDSDGSGNLFLNLGRADIYEVTRIRMTDSDGADISGRFTLDNGQRDEYYDLGKLNLKSGQTAPAGNVFARFKYFAHGTAGDFFSVNSYAGQVNYADIPAFRQNDGELVQLRDVLDFRAVKGTDDTFTGTGAVVIELPQNTDLITADIIYYQPKYAKLIINTSSQLELISGPSSLTPIFPPTPAGALDLYNIKFNAFTLNDSDLSIERVDNRRYTMADIARLETRVDRLEEVTALSLLELDTANFNVLDSTGANRTKSGFFVDNFKDHFFADTRNPEYSASIDPRDRRLRPGFWSESTTLRYDSAASTNTIKKGDNVYLKYSHAVQINQALATGTENVNPFAVITNLGHMTLSPASDAWAEQRRIAARVVDGGDRTIDNELARNWNNWEWNWTGSPVTTTDETTETDGRTTVINSRATTVNSATSVTITQTQTIREVIGDRVVSVALIPFMRSLKIFFKAEGLKANSRMFPFFDGVSVASWCREEAFQNGADLDSDYGNLYAAATQHPDTPSNLITDDEGVVTGSFFVPNTPALSFRTGTREFTLLDISAYNLANSTAIARALFRSSGVIETVQATIVSTRDTTNTIITRLPQSTTTTTVRRNDRGGNDRGQQDPLAQTFYVNDVNGIYLTKVDLYFKTKDSVVPVQVQIRPVVNGHPSSTQIIPGAVKYLSPAAVNVSTNATSATSFEFTEPVYLAPFNEYAIVVLAESTKYNLYVAEIGQFILGSTEKRVTLQPTMGSLFKSQNGSTWEPDQTKDMMFKLWRANFNYTSGSAILKNVAVPSRLLTSDPLSTDSGSSTITVYHPNHGMTVGDIVTIANAQAVGGISASSINGGRTVTAVDYTGYTFTADSAATSSAIGGNYGTTASQNFMFDVMMPNIEVLTPVGTRASFMGKFTSGASYAGSETPYQKDTSYSDIQNKKNNIFSAPRLIANMKNQITQLGVGINSADIKIDLTSSSAKVSPTIDLQRASLILVNNIIDNQDSAATSGFNVPLNFVDETNPKGGSAASKHVTRTIFLEQDAVGIKVIMGVHRPSAAGVKLYYKVGNSGDNLINVNWTEATIDTAVASDENPNIYRDYEYLIGGQGGTIPPFTQFKLKIVFTSTNSSKVPIIRDLRAIALGV